MRLITAATLAALLVLLPLTIVGATDGWITDIKVTQVPTENDTVKVEVKVFVRVRFNSSGEYQVLIEDSDGNEVASSYIYKIGVASDRRMIPLTFYRPENPGNYTYTIRLKVRETGSDWMTADLAKLIFDVLPPPEEVETNQTETMNETTVIQQSTTTVTKAYEEVKNVTVTTTVTVTRNITETNVSTTTVAVTKFLERWKTTTIMVTKTIPLNVTITVTETETATEEFQGRSMEDLIPFLALAGVFVLLSGLILIRRRVGLSPT